MTFPFPQIPPANAVASIVYASNNVSTAGLTTYTFASQAIGTAAGDRKVVVSVSGQIGGTSVSSMTVGGISATLVVALAAGGIRSCEIWQAAVPTGTTADIVITWGAPQIQTGIGVWAVYGAASAATDTGTSVATPLSDTLNIPAGGVAVGYTFNAGGNSTVTWTNLTENFDGVVRSDTTHSGACANFATQQTGLAITATQTAPAGPMMVIASWGPA